MLNDLISLPNRNPVLFAGLAATAMLCTAFIFQALGYAPCELCWWQRYPYMAIIPVALIGLALPSLKARWVLILLALLFAADAGIAAFHVGVEQRWWEGLETCSGYVKTTDNINDALAAIMDAPLIRCDEIAWSLFGISMAGYNALIAAGLALFCLKKSGKI